VNSSVPGDENAPVHASGSGSISKWTVKYKFGPQDTLQDTPQHVYARMLFQKGMGFPMWVPEPSQPNERGVDIGDVGVLSDGSFDFLFNICKGLYGDFGLDERVWSLPTGFKQLAPPEVRTLPDDISPGSCVIQGIDLVNDGDDSSTGNRMSATISGSLFSADISFSRGLCNIIMTLCPISLTHITGRDTPHPEGATLVLPSGATRIDALSVLDFYKEALHNTVDWYAYARNIRRRVAPNGTLILVTGCHKTASWGVASVSKHATKGPASLSEPSSNTPTFRIHDGLSQLGNARSNQCVFIRGLVMKMQGGTFRQVSSKVSSIEDPKNQAKLLAAVFSRKLEKSCIGLTQTDTQQMASGGSRVSLG
jgi:hypothetical protein